MPVSMTRHTSTQGATLAGDLPMTDSRLSASVMLTIFGLRRRYASPPTHFSFAFAC